MLSAGESHTVFAQLKVKSKIKNLSRTVKMVAYATVPPTIMRASVQPAMNQTIVRTTSMNA